MKEAGIILLVLLMVICIMVNDVWAGAQVYFTLSIGGGLFIGVIGVCLQVAFQQRIAQEESKQLAAAQPFELEPNEPDLTLRRRGGDNWASPQIDRPDNIGRAARPNLEVNFYTFRW